MRYFLHISYNGFNYRGYQKQDGVSSVQETIENALSHILKEAIVIVGCGRTDAQVHATQFFAHMDTEISWDFDLAYRLNQLLPINIVIYDIIKVASNQHARFDASQRTYDYYIHTEKNPFLDETSYFYPCKNLNIDNMNSAVSALLKYQDFQAFCKTPEHNQSTICLISSAKLFINQNGNQLQFQISANRFLRGMIRVIVQKLLEIGTGEKTVEEFESLLIKNETPQIKSIAAPYGLYLSKVTYPFLNIESRATPPPNFTK
jgi:tRNA pseudouridine38-40 synthase